VPVCRRLIVALAAALALLAAPAFAAVKLSFWSHDFGNYFPHAFIMLSGAPDADPGAPIQINYGFTAKSITPGILFGPVKGEILSMGKGYVRGSQRHFSVVLTDAQYGQVLALVDQWRNMAQPSYDLHHRNCVSFVKAVAELIGLNTDHTERYTMKPRSFLDQVGFDNPGEVNMADSYVPKLHAPEGQGRKSLSAAAEQAPQH